MPIPSTPTSCVPPRMGDLIPAHPLKVSPTIAHDPSPARRSMTPLDRGARRAGAVRKRPACISAAPMNVPFTTWSPKSSHAMDEAGRGPRQPIELSSRRNSVTVRDNGAASGRPAPEFPANRAGGDPLHPPLGGSFEQGLFDSGGLNGVGSSSSNALRI